MGSPKNWSDLPDLILLHLARLLYSDLPSLYNFASACRPWSSFLCRPSTISLLRLHLPPLLFLPPQSFQSPSPPFSVHEVTEVTIPISIFSHFHIATSCGLIITKLYDDRHITLTDPVTGAQTTTPDIPRKAKPIMYYAALTAPAHHPFYYPDLTDPARTAPVLLLFQHNSEFLRLRGGRWSTHSLPSHVARVVSFKNQRILAINEYGTKLLEFFNLGSDRDDEVRVEVSAVSGIEEFMIYDILRFSSQLIVCGDDLLLLLFVQEEFAGDVIKVNSYRLDFEKMAWVAIERLQDYALFVDGCGKCAVACYMPERWGVMSDCVYVTGPGPDAFIRLPIGGRTFSRHCDCSFSLFRMNNCGPVCAMNMRGHQRWPSPMWIYPTMFF